MKNIHLFKIEEEVSKFLESKKSKISRLCIDETNNAFDEEIQLSIDFLNKFEKRVNLSDKIEMSKDKKYYGLDCENKLWTRFRDESKISKEIHSKILERMDLFYVNLFNVKMSKLADSIKFEGN
jgi:hypothetical protein